MARANARNSQEVETNSENILSKIRKKIQSSSFGKEERSYDNIAAQATAQKEDSVVINIEDAKNKRLKKTTLEAVEKKHTPEIQPKQAIEFEEIKATSQSNELYNEFGLEEIEEQDEETDNLWAEQNTTQPQTTAKANDALAQQIRSTYFTDVKNKNEQHPTPNYGTQTQSPQPNYTNLYSDAAPVSNSLPNSSFDANLTNAASALKDLSTVAKQYTQNKKEYSHVDMPRDLFEFMNSARFRSGVTMEDIFCEVMAPAVKDWVNKNAERIFREMTQSVINRIIEESKQ